MTKKLSFTKIATLTLTVTDLTPCMQELVFERKPTHLAVKSTNNNSNYHTVFVKNQWQIYFYVHLVFNF